MSQPDWSNLEIDTDLDPEDVAQLLETWTTFWPAITAQIATDLRTEWGQEVRYFPSGEPMHTSQIHGENLYPVRLCKEKEWNNDAQGWACVFPNILILRDESIYDYYFVHAYFTADGMYLTAEIITG